MAEEIRDLDPADMLRSDEAIGAVLSGLPRAQLQRSLAEGGIPSLEITLGILRALGVGVSATPLGAAS
ncbi:transcriptional regulator [Methylobacterium sp. CB376]|uniref:transcriptional regulator n=1 Tax=unclassified Methylobacterium TaxID=2615210 RepID=UPI000152DF8D|nr:MULTISPECIES: transcriptional regulator [Methylobacterium]WFT79311.1 transcriptional regulator [Methylobacterium nodulans]